MKNQEHFDKTIQILVKAYLNNTLVPGNCHACAVGNLIAANLHLAYDTNMRWKSRQVAWPQVFVTLSCQISQIRRPWAYGGQAKEQIDATGYSWQDLARLEYAFERAPGARTREARMFNGLMAVVEVLCQIHEMNEETKVATQKLFEKAGAA